MLRGQDINYERVTVTQCIREKSANVHVERGFIPLWDENVELSYSFAINTLDADKTHVRQLIKDACNAWGSASPITIVESTTSARDFDIEVKADDSLGYYARAFFPSDEYSSFYINKLMFTRTKEQQVGTMIHEMGHIFGLRHTHAEREGVPYRHTGTDAEDSIMSYGEGRVVTDLDKYDLKKLYENARKNRDMLILGTAIKFFKPYTAHCPQDHDCSDRGVMDLEK